MANPLPPLSELLSWSTDHLTVGADYWDALARRWESSFKAIHQQVRFSGWEGQAHDAAHERTYWDSARVDNVADDLRDTASAARYGASDVTAAQGCLREAVSAAQHAGFFVSVDITVTSREAIDPSEQAQRPAQAESLAEDISWRAVALVDTDQQVGTRITEAVERLSDPVFEEHGRPSKEATEEQAGDGAQLVDFSQPKQSPIPEPGLPSDPNGVGQSPSAADIRTVLEKLPQGDRPWIREVRTPDDLHRLWK